MSVGPLHTKFILPQSSRFMNIGFDVSVSVSFSLRAVWSSKPRALPFVFPRCFLLLLLLLLLTRAQTVATQLPAQYWRRMNRPILPPKQILSSGLFLQTTGFLLGVVIQGGLSVSPTPKCLPYPVWSFLQWTSLGSSIGPGSGFHAKGDCRSESDCEAPSTRFVSGFAPFLGRGIRDSVLFS